MGKSSISMGHGYTMAMLNNQSVRWLEACLWCFSGRLRLRRLSCRDSDWIIESGCRWPVQSVHGAVVDWWHWVRVGAWCLDVSGAWVFPPER
jgi:hypothetical protein